jgi:hypothetical protein
MGGWLNFLILNCDYLTTEVINVYIMYFYPIKYVPNVLC